ncbi:hypothetical protein IAT38_004334 [Cryptococcus sp. DSM 104549]
MNKDRDASAPAGSSKKSTVYVAGIAPEVSTDALLQAFVTFGDIIDIKIPNDPHNPKKHRGFAFITFSSAADAQEAIDNYDLNQLPGHAGRGRFLKCSLAAPNKFGAEDGGKQYDRAVWESDEWKAEHGKPLEGEDGEGEGESAAAA